ncbi:MAG: rRNA maturation RNase YbeY [Pseudomonadota bacterium]
MACDDERISALNGRFRSKPVPTNVLSWPSLDLAAAADGSPPADPPGPACGRSVPLGDLALSLETMEREARDQDLHLKSHTWHLILHGCLHLLGYDHERPGDAALMEGMESRVLRAAGLPDPYC